MKGYPLERLHEEIAFLAYYLHWDYTLLMNLDHQERQQWVSEVNEIHKKLGEESGEKSIETLL